jgi:hypothetical protein
MKTGTYNTRLTFVGIICLFVAALCLITSCTDEEIIQDEQTSTSTDSDYGVPMVLDVTINDYDGVTSSRATSDNAWPDGATLRIRPYSSMSTLPKFLKSGCTCIFAVYYTELGWVAYNLDNNVNSDNEALYGYSSAEVCYLDTYRYSPGEYAAGEYDPSAPATCKLYGNDIDKTDYYYYKGVFHLTATLEPKIGRVRFKGASQIDVLYNHARYYISSSSYAKDRKYGDSYGVLSFTKDADGEYYSNYIYARYIPDLRIGDYVYRYKGSLWLTSGKSGVIDLPTEDNYSTNWIREPYFEETKSIEETLTASDYYYHIYAQEYSGNIREDSNAIESQVGLNIEVAYTPNSWHPDIELNVYTDSSYDDPYSGLESDNTSHHIASCHCCGRYRTKFYPIIHASVNQGATIHSIKISNF